MGLLQFGNFVLSSGRRSQFKIDCDSLSDVDIATAAAWLAEMLPPFGLVEGVPRGGLRLAEAMRPYATTGPLLICDDVSTSGASLERQRAGREAIGAVLFARGPCPAWVTPLFMGPPLAD